LVSSSENPKPVLLASTVSSKALAALAAVENCTYMETLTGFKWLANRALDCLSASSTSAPSTPRASVSVPLIFAYEEAIGYMLDPRIVPDKDGVSALAVFLKLAAEVYAAGLTVSQRLESVYERIGFFECCNSYVGCSDAGVIREMFGRIRSGCGGAGGESEGRAVFVREADKVRFRVLFVFKVVIYVKDN
jgi:phosphoglucomutase